MCNKLSTINTHTHKKKNRKISRKKGDKGRNREKDEQSKFLVNKNSFGNWQQ